MKNKTKMVTAIMLTIILINCFTTVFAAVSTNPDGWTGTSSKINDTQVKDFSNGVINVVSLVGSAVAIIALIVLGMKYMMGSAEEKAEYKKTLLPYIIGAVMVFGASVLTGFIYNMMVTK